MLGNRGRSAAALAVFALVATGCSAASSSDDSTSVSLSSAPDGRSEGQPKGAPRAAGRATTVVAISVDGLNPSAIRRLGTSRTPTLHRLIRGGASTLNARTEREQTNTLPNHTGMVTSRRINASYGGHGITWNDDADRRPTVNRAAGEQVASVFGVVHNAGKKTALYASKPKFDLFERSWPGAVDRYVQIGDNGTLVDRVVADLRHHRRTFRFVHLSAPDGAGHAHGFMSRSYLNAVAATDRRIGRIVAAIRRDPGLARRTTVILTADHGGRGESHRDQTDLDNYRIPFIVWGAGVRRGAHLYRLNHDYKNPGRKRPGYAARKQPVRNGDLANLATDLLGLGRLRGSELNARQNLDVR